jgi:hypothetical protein
MKKLLIFILLTLNLQVGAEQMKTLMLQDIDYGKRGMLVLSLFGSGKFSVKTSAPIINHEKMVYEESVLDWTYFWAGTGLVPVNEQSVIIVQHGRNAPVKLTVKFNEETGRFNPIGFTDTLVEGV